ncbi:MAG: cobalamin biosynthesis protein, partial [Pseudomonadota bacterium]
MTETPVVIALTESGAATAGRLAQALGAPLHGRAGRVTHADAHFPNALDHVRDLFAARISVVGVCAAGILIRAVAPLLSDKRAEPPVVAVAEDGSAAIPLLGGHRGANRLAREIAEILGANAQITTAGDLSLGLALDDPPPGWALTNPGDAKGVMAAALSGAELSVAHDDHAAWLSTLTAKGRALRQKEGTVSWHRIRPGFRRDPTPLAREADVHPRVIAAGALPLLYRAKRLALGIGCARNCPPEEIEGLFQAALTHAMVEISDVSALYTIDLKADEPAILALADRHGLPLRLFSAAELEAETSRLANPSDVVFAEVGCHGVAEAAALAGTGPGGCLLVEKQKTANATLALALAPGPITALEGRRRGRVSLVGIGPGQAAWRTPEASRLIAEAEELVGYGLYIDLLGPLAAGKPRHDFPLGGEEARCRFALERAAEG